MAFVVAAVCMAGSLYFSEVAHFPPCHLCWLQRFWMYPLVPILGLAALFGGSRRLCRGDTPHPPGRQAGWVQQGNYPPSAWLKDKGWTAPTLADSDDGKAADAFGLPGFPSFVAVDGSGKVVARTSGEISTDDFAGLAAKALGNQ